MWKCVNTKNRCQRTITQLARGLRLWRGKEREFYGISCVFFSVPNKNYRQWRLRREQPWPNGPLRWWIGVKVVLWGILEPSWVKMARWITTKRRQWDSSYGVTIQPLRPCLNHRAVSKSGYLKYFIFTRDWAPFWDARLRVYQSETDRNLDEAFERNELTEVLK